MSKYNTKAAKPASKSVIVSATGTSVKTVRATKVKAKVIKPKVPTYRSKPVINEAGGSAFSVREKTELVTILLSSFIQDTMYKGGSAVEQRIKELVAKIKDKKFIAKAAIYARNEFGMRSVSHAVAAELAACKDVKGEAWTKSFFDKVIFRVDDMMEILGCYWKPDSKRPIPNSMKKGFRLAFNKFDTFQLSKYQANSGEITLVDLVNLVHPVSNPGNQVGLAALMRGSLKNLSTSQRALTNIGQVAKTEEEKDELRADYFETVIKNRKIGFTDLVRSLTKIISDAPKAVAGAVEMLTDKNLVKKSKMFPYQIYIALKMVEKNSSESASKRKILSALEETLEISCDNVPEFKGNTAVIVDRSGSMSSPLSSVNDGIMSMAEAGTLMALFIARKNNCDFVIFGDSAKYVPFNPKDSILASVKKLLSYNGGGYGNSSASYDVGHGTNFSAAFQVLNQAYDRVIIFSDMQGWGNNGAYGCNHAAEAYKRLHKANPFIYSHDLHGSGSLQFPEEKTFVSAGFSDKIFSVMEMLERNKEAMVTEIDKIEL